MIKKALLIITFALIMGCSATNTGYSQGTEAAKTVEVILAQSSLKTMEARLTQIVSQPVITQIPTNPPVSITAVQQTGPVIDIPTAPATLSLPANNTNVPPANPSAASIPPGRQILFQPWTTSAILDGVLNPNQLDQYYITAEKAKTMMMTVSSRDDAALLEIYGLEDGIPLVRPAADATHWEGVLARTQNYSIKVFNSTDQVLNYSLEVIIPARISFQPGAISAITNGKVQTNSSNHYLLKAMQNQNMTVNIIGATGQTFLTIMGMEDRSPLIRAAAESATFTGRLPLTQDYLIQVVNYGPLLKYQLETVVR